MLVTLTIFQDFDLTFFFEILLLSAYGACHSFVRRLLDLTFWRRFRCLLPLFEDFGYISLMICAKGLPVPSSTTLQPRLEFVTGLLPSLGLSHDWADSTALWGPRLAISLQRVGARKKVSTLVTR